MVPRPMLIRGRNGAHQMPIDPSTFSQEEKAFDDAVKAAGDDFIRRHPEILPGVSDERKDIATRVELIRRIETLEDVLLDLLRENYHQLVGGQAFAEAAIERIIAARAP